MSGTALIIVDVQNDFLPPDGSLAVSDGDKVIPVILKLLEKHEKYDLIVATLDYHPPNHVSFASTHSLEPFTSTEVLKLHSTTGETVSQMLWPDHCVQRTPGCEVDPTLKKRLDELGDKVHYIQKGTHIAVDAYSGFADNQYTHITSLPRLLYSQHPTPITKLHITGLATDYCVLSTSIDACKFGFETTVLKDACRGVFRDKDEECWESMRRWGCFVSESGEI